ncbi:MAG: hypothetical protein QOC78_1784 [Solirubrobacteraceae bacterium]|jgi:hypothetical protein|nr:hypothetical protein [Solirubrobacteraceae bacterium]
MGQPDSPFANERSLSTHEAADIIGCHPQTVRDRCARGELPFTVDPATGHRRIAARSLEELGYTLPTGRPTPSARAASRTRFQASVTAELAGALSDGAAEYIADRVVAALAERDAALAAAAHCLGETQAELQALARARFWQRPRLLARLRAQGVIAPAEPLVRTLMGGPAASRRRSPTRTSPPEGGPKPGKRC